MNAAQILTVNVGSSSVRLAMFTAQHGKADALERTHEQHIGLGDPVDPSATLQALGLPNSPAIVVHRIVHGGDQREPASLTPSVEAEIQRASIWAPAHNPHALQWVRAVRSVFGAALPQHAVFDTGIYRQLSAAARTLPLPAELRCKHWFEKIGFHGLAHTSMRKSVPWPLRRIVTLQLGSGCSATAFRDGIAVDTSMGPSTLAGLPMATRSGDLDPGAILHLLQEHDVRPERLADLLARESGLRGLAGTPDMRALLARGDAQAQLALEVFCDRVRKQIGSFAAVLGGLDYVVVGGGIGEHAPEIRARIFRAFDFLGIQLDVLANARTEKGPAVISEPQSYVQVRVAAVDEEGILAEAGLRALNRSGERMAL